MLEDKPLTLKDMSAYIYHSVAVHTCGADIGEFGEQIYKGVLGNASPDILELVVACCYPLEPDFIICVERS